jgi:CheY-like chemotaxis protein
MSKNSFSLKSILIVDDNQESLDLYSGLLKKKSRANIMCTKYPNVAIKWADNYFFDIILIDVTINYNGTQFGGLEVYKVLKGRYGDSSLIVYSQFITEDLLKQYEYGINFIEKKEDPRKFIGEAIRLMNSLRKRQSCFLAMPFSSAYDHIFKAIKASVNDTFYRCIRIDHQQFTKSIIEKTFLEIERAKLVIFLATDQNPNAFYECGYAVALKKEVITLTDVYENLPFNIKVRTAISYGTNIKKLNASVRKKLTKLTHIPLQ